MDDDQPKTLDYGSAGDGRHPAVHAAASVAKVLVGAIVGFVAILFVGMFSTGLAESRGEFQFHSVPLAAAYFVAAAGAAAGCTWGLWRAPRKWFLAGLLLGGGVACLIDGTCFLSA